MKTKNFRVTNLSVIALILLLAISSAFSQQTKTLDPTLSLTADEVENTDVEVINIETNLVKVSFIAPHYPNKLVVQDGQNQIKDFTVSKSNDLEPVKWILVLDIKPRRVNMRSFRKHFRNLLKNQNPPSLILVNTEHIKSNRISKAFKFTEDIEIQGAEGSKALWKLAGEKVDKLSSMRKSLFAITSEEKEITAEDLAVLPPNLLRPDIFLYYGTIRKHGAGRYEIGQTNINFNTVYTGGGSNQIEFHFEVFADQIKSLHVVIFYPEASGKRIVRISGENNGVVRKIQVKEIY